MSIINVIQKSNITPGNVFQDALTSPNLSLLSRIFQDQCPASPFEQYSCSKLNACALVPLLETDESIHPQFELVGPIKTHHLEPSDLGKKIGELVAAGNDNELLSLIATYKDILKGEAVDLITSLKVSDRVLKYVVKNFILEINSFGVNNVISIYGFGVFKEIANHLMTRFRPDIVLMDYQLLNFFFKYCDIDAFQKFWDQRGADYFLKNDHLKQGFTHLNPEVISWIETQGVSPQLFNMPTENGRTALESMARRGEMEFVRRVAQQLPPGQLIANEPEEMRDCLLEEGPIDFSRFDFKPVAVAQNGCRAVVLTEKGDVHAFPGSNAKLLAKQMTEESDLESFQIYHNAGHASISFPDSHFGFYPKGNLEKAQMDMGQVAAQAMQQNGGIINGMVSVASSGQVTGSQPGSSSYTHKMKSGSAVAYPTHKGWTISTVDPRDFDKAVSCSVIDDQLQKFYSNTQNGLVLTVFAPRERVQAIREYVEKTQTQCVEGKEQYHALVNNCIHFVQKAVEASGIRSNFRDSFQTMQLLRRIGPANLHSLWISQAPTVHGRNGTFPQSIPDALDSVSRTTVKGALLSIPAALYAGIAYRGRSYAKDAILRSASRIHRVASFAMSLGFGALLAMRRFVGRPI